MKNLKYNNNEARDELVRFIDEKERIGEITRAEADTFLGRKRETEVKLGGRSDRELQEERPGRIERGSPREGSVLAETPALTPSQESLPKYVPVNLNLERIGTPESVKGQILLWREQNRAVLEADYTRFKKGDFLSRLKTESPEVGVDALLATKKYDVNNPQG